MARKPSARAQIAAERAVLQARLAELDALEKQAKVEVRAARAVSKASNKSAVRSGKHAARAGRAEVRQGKAIVDQGAALLKEQQGLFRRLFGSAKRYAPIEGYVPPGVILGADGAISTRQYNKLADEVRGVAKQKQPNKLRNKVNAQKNIVLSRKRDFQAQQKRKGVKVAIKDVGRDPEYQRIATLLDTRTKASKRFSDGRPNQTAVKRALIALGRRDGLPYDVRAGDSGIKYTRDKVTGRWYLKQ